LQASLGRGEGGRLDAGHPILGQHPERERPGGGPGAPHGLPPPGVLPGRSQPQRRRTAPQEGSRTTRTDEKAECLSFGSPVIQEWEKPRVRNQAFPAADAPPLLTRSP